MAWRCCFPSRMRFSSIQHQVNGVLRSKFSKNVAFRRPYFHWHQVIRFFSIQLQPTCSSKHLRSFSGWLGPWIGWLVVSTIHIYRSCIALRGPMPLRWWYGGRFKSSNEPIQSCNATWAHKHSIDLCESVQVPHRYYRVSVVCGNQFFTVYFSAPR